MVIAKLFGGMGNQMFQYALGRHLAIQNNCELLLDVEFFKNYQWHDYSLTPFNIVEQFATEREIRKYARGNIFQRIQYRINKVLLNSGKLIEPHFHFYPKALDLRGNIYIEGYWQSHKYFDEIAKMIRREFTVKREPSEGNRLMLQDVLSDEAVSLHIRRGNYVSVKEVNEVISPCDLGYYHNALSAMRNRVSNPVFYIFSDDINWAREHLQLNAPHHFVDINDSSSDYEDFRLMSSCKHNIIANSTFSWWAAWLNSNTKKIVIAPRKWFNDPAINTNDLIPTTWIRL